jgi:DNA-binding transcriptional regulator/RsmH inhibitor MraZ
VTMLVYPDILEVGALAALVIQLTSKLIVFTSETFSGVSSALQNVNQLKRKKNQLSNFFFSPTRALIES